MINKVLLEGRIVRDFDVNTTGNGTKIVLFVIANTNNSRKDKRTDFIPCVAFGKQAEIAAKYLGKGSLVSVEGSLYVDNKKLEDGTFKMYFNVQCSRIHFLEYKHKENQSTPAEKEMVMTVDFDNEKFNEPTEEQDNALAEFLFQTEADIFRDLPF